MLEEEVTIYQHEKKKLALQQLVRFQPQSSHLYDKQRPGRLLLAVLVYVTGPEEP